MNIFKKINVINRVLVFSTIAIVLVLMLLIGNTYSIFVSSNIDENLNVYKTGNLDITYTLSEDNVNFLDVTPTSIEDSIKIKPYRITVNNAGTVPYMFDLKLLDTTSTDVINYEYIMVQVGKLDPVSLNTTTNNIIKEDIIVPAGESVIVDVRVWLSNEVKNTEIGKSFYAKLSLDGLAIYDNSSDIDNSVLIANRLLSEMEAGSYVLYTGNNGCVGDACSGVNANSSESSNGGCYDLRYEFNSKGFRIAYTDSESAYIISAGSPECMCTASDGTTSNTGCADSETTNGAPVHLENLNKKARSYCNTNYAYLGTCNSSSAWNMNDNDFSNITNNNFSNCYNNSSISCGLGNGLIDIGGYYWYTNPSNPNFYPYVYRWDPYFNFVINESPSFLFGLRPVIKLDTTVVVTGGTGTEDDPYTIENIVPNSLKAFNDINDTSYFHNEAYRTKIKNISFVDYIDTSEAVASWDMSRSNNESIIAWVNNNTTSEYYDLYIGSEKPIKGVSLAYYFSNMTNVDSIDCSNLDTSITRDMQNMFYYTGYSSTTFMLDLGDKFDTSNVTNMKALFAYMGYSANDFILDLGSKFDTSNVTNMESLFNRVGYSSTVFTLDLGNNFDTSKSTTMRSMFYQLGYSNPNFTLDLGDKFDTSNVNNMRYMFYHIGYNSTAFSLDLGDKFDTSKVTDMRFMFSKAGYTSTVFTLDLGDKFDTSNVLDMQSMFNGVGYNSGVFTLDLGDKFDTSSVTNMIQMFYQTGRQSTVFTLDLGDNFDTSNVESMERMFFQIGRSNTTFNLDLGDKFDTSNVTDMNRMFLQLGYYSTVLTLDLGDKFDTSSVVDMQYMFQGVGYSSPVFILNLGSKFDTSNVTNMTNMFSDVGYTNNSLVLDLSTFNFNNVTVYDTMFNGFKSTQKIYVKNTDDQTWITSKGFTNVTTSNVIVKS